MTTAPASTPTPDALPTGRPRSVATRSLRERIIVGSLALSAGFSILITLGILAVLAWETWEFFRFPDVSIAEFFGGTRWDPNLGAEPHFGIWPLVCGTMLVTVIAASFAIPVGLISAIYLSEYAGPRVRAILKPTLEILAGIPTVVYGFFALTVLTPVLQRANPMIAWVYDALGRSGEPPEFGSLNVTSAGLATGIMILPIVCSLSEDALRAVPRSLRDGALALGGTRFDVSVKVVFPAALSGIIAASLLAVSRAVGETMIVALAAGLMPNLTLDPTAAAQTMTGFMVETFKGDADSFSVEYKSSYAVAAMLFAMTLALTLVGRAILRRFREEYD